MLDRLIPRLRDGDDLFAGPCGDVIALHGADGRFTRVSESANELLGREARTLVGQRLTDLAEPSDAARLLAAMAEAAGTGRASVTCEARGTKRPIEVSISRTARGLRSVLRDASGIVAREARLREESAAAVSAADRRTEHLMNVSHEIRTPLGAVIGFADALQRESFGPSAAEKTRDYARVIHDSGQHLLGLVSDLLDLSKAEEGEVALDVEPTDASDLVSTCADIMRLQAKEAGLYLDTVLPENLPALLIDQKLLRQVVLNLLGNALKFTKTGGITLMVRGQEATLLVAVHDTGVGMSQGDLALVGERFKQARREGVRGARGTGIGLSLSHALARVHGGELTLSSAEGRGTTAVLALPLVRADEADEDAGPSGDVVDLAARRAN